MESIINGESGFLIKPGSVNELVEKLIYFSRNPHTAESMGISARKTISDKFNWENTSEKLLEIFTRYAH